MLQIDHPTYLKVAESFKNIPYNLSPAWIDYNESRGLKMVFFTDSTTQPRILSAAAVKNFKFFGEILELEGLFFKEDFSLKQLYGFMLDLTGLNYQAVHMAPKTNYSSIFDIAARKALFKNPIAQSYSNLTVIVDLLDQNPDRNWRRNLKKAEAENFKFIVKKELSVDDSRTIALLNRENAEMRHFRDPLTAEQVQTLVKHPNIYACFLYKDDIPITARIISIEEHISFDMFACNSFASRSNGANHYLMQKIFEYLREHKVRYFDFSEIPVGEEGLKLNGIYEFKKSSGGVVTQYNGEWWWFKSEYIRHIHYFRKLLLKK